MTKRVATEVDVGSESDWCMALHGNHDEHQCHKKPGHEKTGNLGHECYCGVWW